MFRRTGLPFLLTALVIGGIWLASERWFRRPPSMESSPIRSEPTLTLYTYSEFMEPWGAGPVLIAKFEKQCHCRVKTFASQDGGLILSRLKLVGAKADVVLGLNQFYLSAARRDFQWEPIQAPAIDFDPYFPKSALQSDFLPFDWAPMTFVYRESTTLTPPHSLNDLLDSKWRDRIALENPETSGTGMLFALWVMQAHAKSGYLHALQSQIKTLAPSWSSAYGLFERRQASLVFTYLTSVVYHWVHEKNYAYQPAVFTAGHPFAVEYAGIPRTCGQCALARQFIKFLWTEPAQKRLMASNYMLPVLRGVALGTAFAGVPKVKLLPMGSVWTRSKILKRWRASFHGI